jgi:hypothetical protein
MRFRLVARRVFLAAALGLTLASAVTACSSSSSSASTSSAPSSSAPASSASASSGHSNAAAQIKANWEAFFSGIGQGHCGERDFAYQGHVTYDILLAGKPALTHQTGQAVHQDGTWKVGDASFCALLALENRGKAPSVCRSAG